MTIPTNYDRYVVCFSGGKDSEAVVLTLLESGIPPAQIELHHHIVDGREGSTLFDWPCTTAYCKQVGQALGIPVYFSWRVGGIEGELNRDNQPTAAVRFETPTGAIQTVGGDSPKLGTRLRFPALSANLAVRWCSPVAKIGVLPKVIRYQERFDGARTLVLTGERREESTARSKYEPWQIHSADARTSGLRHVDHLRPILDLTEAEVWSLLEKYRIRPHPAYLLGFGRVSCSVCIFASDNQLASIYQILPQQILQLADYEKRFNHTIAHRKVKGKAVQLPILERVAMGTPYPMQPQDIEDALNPHYARSGIMPKGTWKLPAGAFGDNSGPS